MSDQLQSSTRKLNIFVGLVALYFFFIFQLCDQVTPGVTADRSTVLASVIAACRRLLSQPPKGDYNFDLGNEADGLLTLLRTALMGHLGLLSVGKSLLILTSL